MHLRPRFGLSRGFPRKRRAGTTHAIRKLALLVTSRCSEPHFCSKLRPVRGHYYFLLDLSSMDMQLQPSIYPSKSRGKQVLLKTTHLSDYFVCHFPRVLKKEITMRFPRELNHASFFRGLCIFVQFALRDAIKFLVIFFQFKV